MIRRHVTIAAQVVAAAACANIQPPPGGPPDTGPPQLVSMAPDSLAVLPAFDGEVEFRFSEVIAEGAAGQGQGLGDLERLVILSPARGVPEVRWRRNRITVRPREGWEPNRVYRVQLLPGVADLRNNRSQAANAGGTVTFTTGAPVPTASLRGAVYDWTTGQPAAGALVEAVLIEDSLPYRIVADSGGRFALGPVPSATYDVFGVIDQDRDHARDPGEAFDSVRVAAGADTIRLWTFPRDTTPPRIRDITVRDSVTATVAFTSPLHPAQAIDTVSAVLVRLPDSTRVPVVSLGPLAPGDSAPAILPGMRAPLIDRLILRVRTPWAAGTRYALRVRGVRNAAGLTGDVTGVLDPGERPAAVPPPLQPPVNPPPQQK